jgi:2-oxoisovalerate dehydrogenase E1 component
MTTSLSLPAKKDLLRLMLRSRLGDLREQSLIRQGKGWFHVSGMGHEALVAAGRLLQDGDFFAGYYRDRPIAVGRGVDSYELALAFHAKRLSANGGRQMPAHYSNRELGIFSIASVVAASLLPACGLAWGLKLDGKPNAVLTTVGDAGTRQGDFFECVAFALEKQLPLLVLVEDNGIGISTVTRETNPLALGVFNRAQWQEIDGCDVNLVHQTLKTALDAIRAGSGPQFVWCRTERISSHSSADDQRKYRPAEELATLDERDPILRLKRELIEAGKLTEDAYDKMRSELEAEIRAEYERAAEELDPDPAELLDHVMGDPVNVPSFTLQAEEKPRMVDTINATFHAGLRKSRDFVFFGQDIADPKGGVFSLTKGLSDAHPENVFNSPLAESTILGVAVGLAAYGKRPVFEIQFADYIWAGFNQLVTHFSTLHWRSNGMWSAPAVIYAPYGAYLPGGALWHSQTNEAALAHFPGLQIAIPSTPEDAAGLFWSAMHGSSPTIILIPKHLMWRPHALRAPIQPVPLGKARIRQNGSELTLVTWGNCTEIVQEALLELDLPEDSVEVIDLRSIVPLDLETIRASLAKTGRLLVVQEDGESCSIGQKILSRMTADPAIFSRLRAAPVLLSKPDVHIGYNPVLEYAALPDKARTAEAIRRLLATTLHDRPASTSDSGHRAPESTTAARMLKETFLDDADAESPASPKLARKEIKVPILGEGITSARVISLDVRVGDEVQPDDPLCEVETDKALFPIESPFAGRVLEWHIAEGDEVEVDQLIAILELETAEPTGVSARPAAPAATSESGSAAPSPAPVSRVVRPSEGGLPPRIVAQMRNVVPAHMTVKAGYAAIRDARAEAKRQLGAEAPSPTVMIAYALVRAMAQHPIFTCTVNSDDTLSQHDDFDFGVAVSLANDALDTAVIHQANRLDWEDFASAYAVAVQRVRAGNSVSKSSTPLILTSMGGFKVRDALPVVVPPAIGTLFVGEAHYDDTPAQDAREVVSLCLSFDHRWLNGVAGAQFLAEVVEQMETFRLPQNR